MASKEKDFYSEQFTVFIKNFKVKIRKFLLAKERSDIDTAEWKKLFTECKQNASTFNDVMYCWKIVPEDVMLEVKILFSAKEVAKTPKEEFRVWRMSRPENSNNISFGIDRLRRKLLGRSEATRKDTDVDDFENDIF